MDLHSRTEHALVSKLLNRFSTEYLRFLQQQIIATLSARVPHRERVRASWDARTYSERNNFSSPSSPSLGDIELFDGFLGGLTAESSVLLLGSTPALRQLLHDRGVQNYVIADFSYPAILGSADLIPSVDISKEIWVKSDWLQMPLARGHFDYILGDLIFTQIVPERQSGFFEMLSTLLSEDGLIITRAHYQNEGLMEETPAEIIRRHARGWGRRPRKGELHGLIFALRDRLRDDATQLTPPSAVIMELLQYQSEDEEQSKPLKEAANLLMERATAQVNFVTQSRQELESRLAEFFIPVGAQYASDYKDAGYFPVYALRRAD